MRWARAGAKVGVVAAALAACGGEPRATPRTAPPAASGGVAEDPCAAARVARARVPGLLAEGRLHRTLRVIAAANAACPADAPSTWATEIRSRAELGAWDDVRALAAKIAAAADAPADAREEATSTLDDAKALDVHMIDDAATKAPMRETYKRAAELEVEGKLEDAYAGYLEAWELWHPNGQALVQAGLVARRLGRAAEAQRLFDRGIAELERVDHATVLVDTANDAAGAGVAWSATGRIAVALDRGAAILAQGSLREVARVGDAPTRSVAFSPDGKLLATGGDDGDVRVYQVGDGSPVARIDEGAGGVTSIAFSADGATIAVATQDSWVRLWTQDGRAIDRLGLSSSPKALAYAADGKRVAIGAWDHSITVWTVGDPTKSLVLEGHAREVTGVAFSPDGSTLASSSEDGTVRTWDPTTGKQRKRLDAPAGVNAIAFSRDGKLLATADSDRRARVWRTADQALVGTFTGHDDGVRVVAFSPDGRSLLTSSFDGSARVWSVADGTELRAFRAHAAPLHAIAFAPRAHTLASGSDDATVRLWDLDGTPQLRTLRGHADDVHAVAFAPDGATLVSAGYDGTIRRWSLPDGAARESLPGKLGAVYALAFGPGGAALASVGTEGTWIFDLPSASAPRRLQEKLSYGVAFSPDGALLATKQGPDVVLASPIDGHALRAFAPHADIVQSIAFSPDGATLATAAEDGNVALTRVEDGALLSRLDPSSGSKRGKALYAVRFSSDGTLLAAGGDDLAVHVWSADGKEERASPRGHTKSIRAVAFSADDQLLASASVDGTVLLFRAPTFERILGLRSLEAADAGYVFTEDGYIEFIGAERDKAPEKVLCRVGHVSFPFDVCRERFEVQGLMARALAGDTSFRDP